MIMQCVYCGSEFGDGYCLESPDGCCHMQEIILDGEGNETIDEDQDDRIGGGSSE